jgi:hypothetical protein
MKELLLYGSAGATGVLLGQTGPLLDPGIGSVIGNVGIVGILVWHLWYHTTHSYPKMLAQFAAEQQLLRDANAKEQKELRDIFDRVQEANRRAFLEEQRLLREHTAKETDELRRMLLQTMQAMRVAVHDVKDTAQTTMNKVAEAAIPSHERGQSQ